MKLIAEAHPVDADKLLEHLVELAEGLGVEVRRVDLGGGGGSLVRLRDKHVMFVDTSAHADDQLPRLAADLAQCSDLQNVYMLPELRELINGT